VLHPAGADIPGGRQLGAVPTAAQGLNQLHARGQLLQSLGDGGLLIGEQLSLRGDDIQIGIQPQLVAIGGDRHIALRQADRQVLLRNLLRENT